MQRGLLLVLAGAQPITPFSDPADELATFGKYVVILSRPPPPLLAKTRVST